MELNANLTKALESVRTAPAHIHIVAFAKLRDAGFVEKSETPGPRKAFSSAKITPAGLAALDAAAL
jgi:hypothetical protein